jgi:hypothetical protein
VLLCYNMSFSYLTSGKGVGKSMDINLENLKPTLDAKWETFGRKKNLETSEKVLEIMEDEAYMDINGQKVSTVRG